jgi:hypothetical protein
MEKMKPSQDSMSEIEKQYPHIAKQLCAYWGDAVFENYANKLIIDERGDRQGLPLEVIEELLFLYQLHLKNSNFDPNKISIVRTTGYLNPYEDEK